MPLSGLLQCTAKENFILCNSDGNLVWRGFGQGQGGITELPSSHVFYCGEKHKEFCVSGICGDLCGPFNGCPCQSCLEMVGDEGGNNSLAHLALQNRWSEIERRLLLNDIGDINARAGERKWTTLSYSCHKGQEIIVNLLLLNHAIDINKPNMDGMTPLHEAAKCGHFEIVKSLVESGAKIHALNNYGQSTIDIASDHPAISNYLSSQDRISSLEEPPRYDVSCERMLAQAIEDGDDNMVFVYIFSSPDINLNSIVCDGNTLLCQTALINNTQIAEELINNGASVDEPARCGKTPLFLASKMGHIDMVRLLLKYNAQCNVVNPMEDNWTPLHVALHENHEDVALELLNAGANPMLRSFSSHLPQDYAASDHLKFLLSQYVKKYEYDMMVYEMITSGVITIDQLDNLTEKFTSVYDLRPLCSIANTIANCTTTITIELFKPVLIKALERIISENMVLDDKSLMFFKRMIKYCRDCGFIPRNEYQLWKHRAAKANIQNIDHLIEIMRQVQENTWRLNMVERRLEQVDYAISKVIQSYRQLSSCINNLSHGMNNIGQFIVQQRKREEKVQKQRRVLGRWTTSEGKGRKPD
ncbi:ankyrin [Thraustotheca clavata]|uniref:Ankyrin n=1 Tax=Thraustotheca clavata TaxID=74557 RepID=A0A1V9ZWI9_9STRA|nr:ankyrin [Thraustotheca clavata]